MCNSRVILLCNFERSSIHILSIDHVWDGRSPRSTQIYLIAASQIKNNYDNINTAHRHHDLRFNRTVSVPLDTNPGAVSRRARRSLASVSTSNQTEAITDNKNSARFNYAIAIAVFQRKERRLLTFRERVHSLTFLVRARARAPKSAKPAVARCNFACATNRYRWIFEHARNLYWYQRCNGTQLNINIYAC